MNTRTLITAAVLAATTLIAVAPAFAQQQQQQQKQQPRQPAKQAPAPKKAKNIEICFFTEVNFKQAKYCVHSKRRVARMDDAWKNRIESISTDHASVQICSEPNMRGQCIVISGDKKELPEGLFDHVYSYRVR